MDGNKAHMGHQCRRCDTGPCLVWQSYFISFLHHFISIRPQSWLHTGGWKEGGKSHYQRKWQEIKRAGTVKITHDYRGERYCGREGSGGMESQGEMERVREGNGNAGELLKASPCDKRKKCFRLLFIFLNNRMTQRFVSGHHNTAPDKWASLRAHIRFSQLHLLFMTFFPLFRNDSDLFCFFSVRKYYPALSHAHIIIPASSSRSVFILVMFIWWLLRNVLPPHTDFPHRALWNVTKWRWRCDFRHTWDQSRLCLFQLNPPKKINTAGSASAACSNTIKGKGRKFGGIQKLTHTYTHSHTKYDIYGMDCMLWIRLHTIYAIPSENGIEKIRKGKCYWLVTWRSAAPQHFR